MPSTAATTRTDPAGSRWYVRIGRLGPALVSAALGVALLWLAVPRTVAAWASIDAQPALEKLQSGKLPTDAELSLGTDGLRRAIGWVPSARRLTDLALLELEQALRLPADAPTRAALLAQAERDVVEGLVANPVNGFAWLRLAVLRELRAAPPRLIAAALVQSLDMAPNMRKLWLPRAAMFLSYWAFLNEDERPSMRAQLRTIWVTDKALRIPLLQEADRQGKTLLIAWALGDDPEAFAEFQKLIASLPKPPTR